MNNLLLGKLLCWLLSQLALPQVLPSWLPSDPLGGGPRVCELKLACAWADATGVPNGEGSDAALPNGVAAMIASATAKQVLLAGGPRGAQPGPQAPPLPKDIDTEAVQRGFRELMSETGVCVASRYVLWISKPCLKDQRKVTKVLEHFAAHFGLLLLYCFTLHVTPHVTPHVTLHRVWLCSTRVLDSHQGLSSYQG
jgi:hypothetical protein